MRLSLISTLAIGLMALGLFPQLGLDRALAPGPDTASAIDFFGGDDEEEEQAASSREESREESGAFWRTQSGIPETRPIGIPTSFADLAERVAPAVVSIQTTGTITMRQPMLPPGFEEFFGGSPFHDRGMPRERRQSGEGSGFVISEDGYVVTNNHVIENMDEINVRFLDGKELSAEIIGRDPKTDIALLKIEPGDQKLETLALGDSDAVRPGDWVVAIGNPFGLEHTVTAGIISAKHRRDVTQQSYEDFIQTDAAINPGNSGGPLIDLEGRVIGINTAIRREANTIGFSVPINQAKQILPQLRAEGRVTRGWLGVQIQGVTPELAESFDLESPKGALVSQVLPGTPAARGGLQRGDVIIEFGGEEIEEWRDLPIVVANTPVNQEAEVVVIRDGKRKRFEIEIGILEEDQPLASRDGDEEGTGARAFGLRAQTMTPALAEQLGLEEVKGVVVTEVMPDGPAAEAGIRRGDVILELDQQEVEDARDLAKKLDAADGSVLVLIRRGENTLFVPLKRAG
ncbi:MAG: DegQ family serine endoprotease [bacterium]